MNRRLLLIGVDGFRSDRVFATGLAPTLDELRRNGVYFTAEMSVPTLSGPGWTTILTGLTPEEHGVRENTFSGKRFVPRSDVLSRIAAEDPAATTFAIAGWRPLTDPIGFGPVIATRREDIARGAHCVVTLDGDRCSYQVTDEETTIQAEMLLTRSGFTASFVYLGAPDEAGHNEGVFSEAYNKAIQTSDERIARLMQVVHNRVSTGEEWVVAVTTDHGHLDTGGHGGGSAHERQTFLLVCALGGEELLPQERLAPEQFCDYLLRVCQGE